jgi:hypothetical protein
VTDDAEDDAIAARRPIFFGIVTTSNGSARFRLRRRGVESPPARRLPGRRSHSGSTRRLRVSLAEKSTSQRDPRGSRSSLMDGRMGRAPCGPRSPRASTLTHSAAPAWSFS